MALMSSDVTARRWPPATRVAFRLAVLYLGLHIAMVFVGGLTLVRSGIEFVGTSVFGVSGSLSWQMTGSGDRLVDWLSAATVAILAAIGTTVWSVLDRHRPHYAVLLSWFSVLLRLCLAIVFAGYGSIKLWSLQMPEPSLARMLQPLGSFSPMGVLWTSIGAAPWYESFTGAVELTAAILLFIPRTALLGAVVGFACSVQILVLNLTYDVPVKLFAFHLLLGTLFLIAPDARRLATVFLSSHPVGPSSRIVPGRTLRRARAFTIAQILFGVLVVGSSLINAAVSADAVRRGSAAVPFYGIWTVDASTLGDETQPLVVSNPQQWRHVVFEYMGTVIVRRMDDALLYLPATVDVAAGTITFQGGVSPVARFVVAQPDADHLTLEGFQADRPIRLDLSRLDHTALLLRSRNFSWIQEYPFNR